MGASESKVKEAQRKKLYFLPAVLFFGFLFLPLSSDNRPLRTITVKVAADYELRTCTMWRINIRRLLYGCSKIFEREFGLEFQIEDYEYWNPDRTSRTMRNRLNDFLNTVKTEDYDIVLGLISQKRGNIIPTGIASYIHGYILLEYPESKVEVKRILLHELCHIFGACDLIEMDSIMDTNQSGSKFDEFTRQIIQLNRVRTFQQNAFPLPSHLWNKATNIYEKRYALHRNEPGVALNLILLHLERQNHTVALKIGQELSKLYPESNQIHTLLGNIQNKLGMTELALSEYIASVEYNPNVPETHFNLGLIYTQNGWLDEAISEYQKAIQLRPDYAKAYANLGYTFLLRGGIDQAIEECHRAVNICEELPEAYCTLAAALVLKRYCFERKLHAESEPKIQELTKYFKAEDVIESAIYFCKKAISLKKNLPEAYNILGLAYIYQQKLGEAEKALLMAVELNPTFIEAHMNLGTMYFHSQSPEKAAFHIKKILETDPFSELSFQILKKIFKDENFVFGFAPNSSQFSSIPTRYPAELKISQPNRKDQGLKKRSRSPEISKPSNSR